MSRSPRSFVSVMTVSCIGPTGNYKRTKSPHNLNDELNAHHLAPVTSWTLKRQMPIAHPCLLVARYLLLQLRLQLLQFEIKQSVGLPNRLNLQIRHKLAEQSTSTILMLEQVWKSCHLRLLLLQCLVMNLCGHAQVTCCILSDLQLLHTSSNVRL